MIRERRYVRELAQPRRRILILSSCAAVVFGLLLLRLLFLQVLSGDEYAALSENNRLRLLAVPASRGALLDRNGIQLVHNRPSFNLAVIPQEAGDVKALLRQLASLLKLNAQDLSERFDSAKKRAGYYPVVVATGLNREQVEVLEENRIWLRGAEIVMKPVREYIFKTSAAHLLGYIGEISDNELDNPDYGEYRPGDYVGKSGIEKAWEAVLHGKDGGRQLEVDSRGRVLRILAETKPTVGNSLVLTIDSRLQQTAEQAFGGKAGAAVVMDVSNGDVLAFVSSPMFDPALFANRVPPAVWKSYMEDVRHPMENKALTGMYPPGSTFKIVTALAGLEKGAISEHTSISDPGYYEMGGHKFRDWKAGGHGTVDLRKSLKESCDTYYYSLGARIGVDAIASMANRFMFGSALGIGLSGEKNGLVPTTEWKQKKYGKRWLPGETLPVSIGQGYLLATPIQLASMISTVANNGTIYRPHLVKRIITPDGETVKEFAPEVLKQIGVSPDHLRMVKQGLFAVVNDAGGTGANARLGDVRVAGKTGTSQVVRLGKERRNAVLYKHKDHGLFVAFAPYERPEVAVAVVVEHGGGGGAVAAPIAGRILRQYFDLKRQPVVKQPKPHLDAGRQDAPEEPLEKPAVVKPTEGAVQ